jgi:hypothetical protein
VRSGKISELAARAHPNWAATDSSRSFRIPGPNHMRLALPCQHKLL